MIQFSFQVQSVFQKNRHHSNHVFEIGFSNAHFVTHFAIGFGHREGSTLTYFAVQLVIGAIWVLFHPEFFVQLPKILFCTHIMINCLEQFSHFNTLL